MMQQTPAKTLRTRHSATVAELEKYRLLVESINDYAIFLLDTDGNVLTWNKGAEKNKGWKAEEIIGKHFSNFYLEPDKAARKPERELELARRFGRVEDEDWRVRKDGSQFWANVVITALYDPSGELVGYAKITRDLTERKQHEDELRQANALLRRQQKEMQRLNASKDEFISLASHQLRTPATSIKQHLGMIIEGFLGDPHPLHLSFIQKAYDSNDHQLAIVNSLLKVAQIDAGKVVLHKVPTDMKKLIRNVIDEHSESFRGRKQKVTVKSADTAKAAAVDPRYFRMALENLIDNASKYTAENGVIQITISATDTAMEIAIKDSGVGIAPEDMGKLFGKFQRIPNELSDSVGGSGLGLYWVREVIALHGGTVAVKSKINKGTTFTVSVPYHQADA
jgi:PAS domain S-box-containing protein